MAEERKRNSEQRHARRPVRKSVERLDAPPLAGPPSDVAEAAERAARTPKLEREIGTKHKKDD